jgi:hypothetical protein
MSRCMGGHFIMTVIWVNLELPLAFKYGTHISQSCMANYKVVYFPCRNPQPPIPGVILINIVNCMILVYPNFIEVKHYLAIIKLCTLKLYCNFTIITTGMTTATCAQLNWMMCIIWIFWIRNYIKLTDMCDYTSTVTKKLIAGTLLQLKIKWYSVNMLQHYTLSWFGLDYLLPRLKWPAGVMWNNTQFPKVWTR